MGTFKIQMGTIAPFGTRDENDYEMDYVYDSGGRLYQTETDNGTWYRTVYNSLGEAVSDWVATQPTPWVQTAAYTYDNGGVGDGNLTQETDMPGLSAANRVTDFWYDWRDRLVAEKDGVESNENDGVNRPIIVTTYDNLDEVTETQQYLGDGVTPTISGGVLQALPSSDLRGQEVDNYDDQGRLYQTLVYDVNPSTGAVSTSALTTNFYYDHRGNLMAESDPGGLWTKTYVDGAGRAYEVFTTDGASGTSWGGAADVTNDNVLEQEQMVFDADGNVIETIDSQRFHNATGVGHLGTPTSPTNAARVYYAANYYDNVDRVIASVDAGTYGGTAWTRPSTVPASSPTLLVSQYQYRYTSAGMIEDDIDPMGIDTRTYYDDLGRVTKSVQNYTGNPETTNSDVATEYGYDGNDNVVYVQADEPGGAYQKTAYIYGVTTTAGDGVNSNDILSAIQHPDPSTGNPSSTQQDSYLTNALGQVVQATDRNGNVHQYSYDVLGRITSDNVSTLGTGVDGTVRQMTYAYDSQGNLSLITGLNASGGIVNQVQRVYNGLGQLTGEYQSHNGAVVQGSTPELQYAYTEMSGGQNNSRLTSMTYPSGYVLNYNYNTGLDSNISRLSSISDSANTLESYKYLGLDSVVERDHPQINVNQTYISQNGQTGDGGDQYVGLDRFGRVVDQNWYSTTTHSSVDDFQYNYNQDSEVVSRNNVLDAAMNETYSYDNLGQLTSFARGSHTQTWTPDALGNFTSVTTNGTTQTRTANQQNEYTSISGSGTITYDANGNITADGSGNTFVYDAWNRLVAVKNGSTTLAAYGYDGLGHRITETHGSTSTDLYYSANWQVLEERNNGQLQARYVWSPAGIDTLVLRDDSSQNNGVLDRRLYVQQDMLGNVTALADTSGNVVERYDYDPFGAATVLNPDFSMRGTSSYNWIYLFQGKRYDGAVGLYESRERVYSPTLMRWLQTDPLGQVSGPNGYGAFGNDPTNYTDPSGLARIVRYPVTSGAPELDGMTGLFMERLGPIGQLRQWNSGPDFIGYLDPSTNLVYRWKDPSDRSKGFWVVQLSVIQDEVGSWFFITSDWNKFFEDHAIDPTPYRAKNMAIAMGTMGSNHEDWGQGSRIMRDLAWQGVLHDAGAGFNASPSRFAGRLPGGVKGCPPTPKVGGQLFGHNEYVVADAAKASRVRQGLEAFYRQHAPPGATIRWVDNLPGGRNGALNTRTGVIELSKDLLTPQYRHLMEGTLVEELQHFHQLQSRGWIGRDLTAAESALIEREVVQRIQRSGFRIFDPRRP